MSHAPAPPPYESTPQRGPMPTTMRAAVGAMVLGGVLQLLSPILVFTDMDAVREAASKGSGGTLTPEQLDMAVTIGIVVGVGLAIVGAIFWFVTALLNAKGYGWARIVATCFAAIGVFMALAGLLQDNPVTTKIGNFLLMLVGIVAAVLLWLPESSRWLDAPR